MQTAEVVLNVLRERGRKGLPCEQLYRQLFNKDLYITVAVFRSVTALQLSVAQW